MLMLSTLCGSSVSCFIGVNEKLYFAMCDIFSSPTEIYCIFYMYNQQIWIWSTVLISFITGFTVYRRWRIASKAVQDMKQFNEEVQLQALKIIITIVTLYFICFCTTSLYAHVTALLNWSVVEKSKYLGLVGGISIFRGAFNFLVYCVFSTDYREGFLSFFAE